MRFHACAEELIARHEKGATTYLATAYTFGDGLVAAIPAVQNGFAKTLWEFTPDWHLFAVAYLDRPLPALVSVLLIAASASMKKHFALGHAGQAVGAVILATDLGLHGEIGAALALLPTLPGALFGAASHFLKRRCGSSTNWLVRQTLGRPRRLAGVAFGVSTTSTLISTVITPDAALFVAAVAWLNGNIVSMLLPEPERVRPQSGIKAERLQIK